MSPKPYLAKSNGQLLETHLVATALKTVEALFDILDIEVLKRNDLLVKIIRMAILGGAASDLGKITNSFQKLVDRTTISDPDEEEEDKSKKFNGPYHNEVSWALIKYYLNEPYSSALSNDRRRARRREIVQSCVYYHHPVNYNFSSRDYRFKSVDSILDELENQGEDIDSLLEESKFLIKAVLEKIDEKIGGQYEVSTCLSDQNLDFSDFTTPEFTLVGKNYNQSTIREDAVFKLMLFAIQYGDIQASRMNEDQASRYVDEFSFKDVQTPPVIKKAHKEVIDTSKRTSDQVNIANKIKLKKISAGGFDMGSGKTTVMTLSCETESFMVALPHISKVDALKKTIKKDYLRTFGRVPSVNAIHSKATEYTENADINLIVWDRMLTGLYERKDLEFFYRSMKEDIAIDEFHEIVGTPDMVTSMATFLFMRRLLKPRTILLSGTPDQVVLDILLGGDWKSGSSQTQFIDRTELPEYALDNPSLNPRFKIQLIQDDLSVDRHEELVGDLKDTAIVLNSIKRVQEETLSSPKSFICHSKFIDCERDSMVTGMLKEFGTAKVSANNLISAKLISSSFNLNFSKIANKISIPTFDSQVVGRLNRHKNKNDCTLYIYVSDNPDNVDRLITSSYKLRETAKKWREHLLNTVEDKEYTHRSFLTEIYDTFFECEDTVEVYRNELTSNLTNSETISKMWFPIKGLSAKRDMSKKSTKKITSKEGRSFRGTSSLASFKIVDINTLKAIGQISEDECLSVSEPHIIKMLSKTTNIAIARKNLKGLFSKLTDRAAAIGKSSDMPFVGSLFLEDDLKFNEKISIDKILDISDDSGLCSREQLLLTASCEDDYRMIESAIVNNDFGRKKGSGLNNYLVYTRELGLVPMAMLISNKLRESISSLDMLEETLLAA
jgi:hypothetical protein